jgi:hypothetical protein
VLKEKEMTINVLTYSCVEESFQSYRGVAPPSFVDDSRAPSSDLITDFQVFKVYVLPTAFFFIGHGNKIWLLTARDFLFSSSSSL